MTGLPVTANGGPRAKAMRVVSCPGVMFHKNPYAVIPATVRAGARANSGDGPKGERRDGASQAGIQVLIFEREQELDSGFRLRRLRNDDVECSTEHHMRASQALQNKLLSNLSRVSGILGRVKQDLAQLEQLKTDADAYHP